MNFGSLNWIYTISVIEKEFENSLCAMGQNWRPSARGHRGLLRPSRDWPSGLASLGPLNGVSTAWRCSHVALRRHDAPVGQGVHDGDAPEQGGDGRRQAHRCSAAFRRCLPPGRSMAAPVRSEEGSFTVAQHQCAVTLLDDRWSYGASELL
jgi:hypothetical protein